MDSSASDGVAFASAGIALIALGVSIWRGKKADDHAERAHQLAQEAHKLAVKVEERQRSAHLTVRSQAALADRSGWEVTLFNAGDAAARHGAFALLDHKMRLPLWSLPREQRRPIAPNEAETWSVKLPERKLYYPLRIETSWADDPSDDAVRRSWLSEKTIDGPPSREPA